MSTPPPSHQVARIGLVGLFLFSMIGLSRLPDNATAEEAPAAHSGVRFVNEVSSHVALDIEIDGEQRIEALAYGAASAVTDVSASVVRITVRSERDRKFDLLFVDGLYPIAEGRVQQFVVTDTMLIPATTDSAESEQ